MKVQLTDAELERFLVWKAREIVEKQEKMRSRERRKTLLRSRVRKTVSHEPQVRLSKSPYIANYEQYRATFNVDQRHYYEEIMQGRSGRRAEAEAVDLVMRESSLKGIAGALEEANNGIDRRATLCAETQHIS